MRVIPQIEVFCWGVAAAAAAASSRCCLDCFGPSVPGPDRQTRPSQSPGKLAVPRTPQMIYRH